MRAIHTELAEPVGRALVTVTDVDGGPTDEQLAFITSILHGYFGVDLDPATLEPLRPDEIMAHLPDERSRHRLVELTIALEFCRHPASQEQALAVERYAAGLGIDEELQRLARDYAEGRRDHLNADFVRYRADHEEHKAFVRPDDPELAARLHALEHCAPDTLGRAFWEFYDRWNLTFPGEPGGGDASLVAHDFSHVLTGYEPLGPGEIALQAIIVSSTDGDEHFSGFLASLSLYEIGMFDNPIGLENKTETLTRPGAMELLADAIRRGASCTGDFSAVDHLSMAHRPLDEVRAELGIPPLTLSQ
jgi:hypothetical protein